MNILVIRFRQMGDAILSTPMLTSLRQSFPDARIDFVLNERIAPLFSGHPAIDNIITFSDSERHRARVYIKKVWQTVHDVHYDVIIDMRSTFNTMLFALFSPTTHYRIGIRKPYTWLVFNHRFEGCEDNESMIDHNLKLLSPLKPEHTTRELSLSITDKEKQEFRLYMEKQGIDFRRPVALIGVTAKLENKTWAEDRMTEILKRMLKTMPEMQLVFNYAPGREAENARRIYENLGAPPQVFINIEAKSMRQLAAMSANCTLYFGNEGGARHIVHAMGKPSLVVCSPMASKKTWLPTDTGIAAVGIAPSDVGQTEALSREEQYSLITVERVWEELERFLSDLAIKKKQ